VGSALELLVADVPPVALVALAPPVADDVFEVVPPLPVTEVAELPPFAEDLPDSFPPAVCDVPPVARVPPLSAFVPLHPKTRTEGPIKTPKTIASLMFTAVTRARYSVIRIRTLLAAPNEFAIHLSVAERT
jgi:hypothetical protein